MTTFTELGLAAPLLKALDAEGYSVPTPIQAQAIPPVMSGRDVLGIAQTGTGKTAAFALPILHRLAADKRPAPRKGARVLVLSPTRELASQIAESFRTYGRNMGLTVAVVFGGVGFRPQVQALSRGVDVLVATPGRLIDHMTERTIELVTTEVLVLDEADQMLDLGFFPAIRRICSALTAKRQNLLFSATMPNEIGKLADGILKDPVKVSVAPVATTVEKVDQRVILIEQKRKKDILVELLANEAMARTLVFTRTKRGADRVADYLEGAGITVAAIHGNKGQSQREKALAAFKDNRIRVLVATDIAARGIDVDLVTHVVNYELPDVPESYVHRIGRTARAGAAGVAIALVDHEERGQLRDIERLTRQSIPAEDRRDPNARPQQRESGRPESRQRQGQRQGQQRQGQQRGPRQGESRGNGQGQSNRQTQQQPTQRSARPAELDRRPSGATERNGRSDDRRQQDGQRQQQRRSSGGRNRQVAEPARMGDRRPAGCDGGGSAGGDIAVRHRSELPAFLRAPR